MPAEKQKRAVKFLVDNVFVTPRNLINAEVITRITPTGFANRILNGQRQVMNSLLREDRIVRLSEHEAIGRSGYSAKQLISDVQNGIWSELNSAHPSIEIYRRNLQRAYLVSLRSRLVGDGASTSEFRPLMKTALAELLHKVEAKRKVSMDVITASHQLVRTLD